MYTLYKFHFLNGISEINQLFDDILIMTSTCIYACMCVCVCMCVYIYIYIYNTNKLLVFHECILQQYNEQCIILPDLVLFTFICSPLNVFFFH